MAYFKASKTSQNLQLCVKVMQWEKVILKHLIKKFSRLISS